MLPATTFQPERKAWRTADGAVLIARPSARAAAAQRARPGWVLTAAEKVSFARHVIDVAGLSRCYPTRIAAARAYAAAAATPSIANMARDRLHWTSRRSG